MLPQKTTNTPALTAKLNVETEYKSTKSTLIGLSSKYRMQNKLCKLSFADILVLVFSLIFSSPGQRLLLMLFLSKTFSSETA